MAETKKQMRVLLASSGVDPHDQGMKVISFALREAGMEVIYLGRFLTPQQIVDSAIQENVDVIGLSDHMGGMPIVAGEVLKLLKARKVRIPMVTGGLLSDEDIQLLNKMGAIGNWVGGTPTDEIVAQIAALASD